MTNRLYHPIPLEIIRGLAKQANLQIGRIANLADFNDRTMACYFINIAELPGLVSPRQVTPDSLADLLATIYPRDQMKVNRVIYNGDYWSFELWAYNQPQESDQNATQ